MKEVTRPESLRVFVAVAIPDEVNAKLAALQASGRKIAQAMGMH